MEHIFGGSWTDLKLDVMERYFGAYMTALKHQHFECWYIDAFAGTGERTDTRNAQRQLNPFFGDEAAAVQKAKDGSVQIALKIEPPFRRYILIERAKGHVKHLQNYQSEFPNRKINVLLGDANEKLLELCRSTDWIKTRAAIFVDPYGMQVNWQTLEALAKTKAVDLALLYPTGPLNRMLVKDGDIPVEWQKRIDDHLGNCPWRKAFYRKVKQSDLFQNSIATQKIVNVMQLREFVRKRLRSIFAYVHDDTVSLRNSKGVVLYDLFIICANPSEAAIKLARKLANGAIGASKKRKV